MKRGSVILIQWGTSHRKVHFYIHLRAFCLCPVPFRDKSTNTLSKIWRVVHPFVVSYRNCNKHKSNQIGCKNKQNSQNIDHSNFTLRTNWNIQNDFLSRETCSFWKETRIRIKRRDNRHETKRVDFEYSKWLVWAFLKDVRQTVCFEFQNHTKSRWSTELVLSSQRILKLSNKQTPINNIYLFISVR